MRHLSLCTTKFLGVTWMGDKLTVQEQIDLDKEQRIMETVAWRCAYYRANPNRYISEVLNISLKPL